MGKFVAPALVRVPFTKAQLRELIAALDSVDDAKGSVIEGVRAKLVRAHDYLK